MPLVAKNGSGVVEIDFNGNGNNFLCDDGLFRAPAPVVIPPAAASLAQTIISSAQILNLNNVPIAVVPAPGAGNFILPFSMAYQFKPGSVAYTLQAGDKLQITPNLSDPAVWSVPCAGLLDAIANSADKLDWSIRPTSDSGAIIFRSHLENTPLLLNYNSFQNPLNGNGILIVNILYAVVALQ